MDIKEFLHQIGEQLETQANEDMQAKKELMAKINAISDRSPRPKYDDYVSSLKAIITAEEGADPESPRGQRLRLFKVLLKSTEKEDPEEWDRKAKRHNEKLKYS